jgi:hypothetical protein
MNPGYLFTKESCKFKLLYDLSNLRAGLCCREPLFLDLGSQDLLGVAVFSIKGRLIQLGINGMQL